MDPIAERRRLMEEKAAARRAKPAPQAPAPAQPPPVEIPLTNTLATGGLDAPGPIQDIECARCGETIKARARECRFCGQVVGAPIPSEAPAPEAPEATQPSGRQKKARAKRPAAPVTMKDGRLAAALAFIFPGAGHFYAAGCLPGLLVGTAEGVATAVLLLVGPFAVTLALMIQGNEPSSSGFTGVVWAYLAALALKAAVCWHASLVARGRGAMRTIALVLAIALGVAGLGLFKAVQAIRAQAEETTAKLETEARAANREHLARLAKDPKQWLSAVLMLDALDAREPLPPDLHGLRIKLERGLTTDEARMLREMRADRR